MLAVYFKRSSLNASLAEAFEGLGLAEALEVLCLAEAFEVLCLA